MPVVLKKMGGLAVCILFLLAGCSSVKVSTVDSTRYVVQQRGDVITSGELSQPSVSVLYMLDSDPGQCRGDFGRCIQQVLDTDAVSREQQLATLSEIWLLAAMEAGKAWKPAHASGGTDIVVDRERLAGVVGAYLESARYAYAYLFFSGQQLWKRALEDRQTQVRDYYNYSVQNAISYLYMLYRADRGTVRREAPIGNWHLSLDESGISRLNLLEDGSVSELVPDTTLNFDGLRNQYLREGIGARMVLTIGKKGEAAGPETPWRHMPYVSVTSIIRFRGESLAEILRTREAVIAPYETCVWKEVEIGKEKIPLGANYSSAYGLWLANSDFATQSLGTIFGKGNVLDYPTLFLMQPYQPDRRTVILVHGLASSPEAWVNAANEIMGDEKLRQHYQIWQIYYPTSVPIVVNRRDIARVIRDTLDHYDPQRKNPASRDMVLVGHSMGGILSRLMVSGSGMQFWDDMKKEWRFSPEHQEKIREKLGEYIRFEPLPEVSRAVFLAAPHRGTPFADRSFAKWLAGFVKLPYSVMHRLGDAARLVFGKDVPHDRISSTGVDNLSAQDPVIRSLSRLRISQGVKYHSIIGVEDMDVPLQDSSDGIVPYTSSHWDGAESEIIVHSGHSVQETSRAILEIRRILHEHLDSLSRKTCRQEPAG